MISHSVLLIVLANTCVKMSILFFSQDHMKSMVYTWRSTKIMNWLAIYCFSFTFIFFFFCMGVHLSAIMLSSLLLMFEIKCLVNHFCSQRLKVLHTPGLWWISSWKWNTIRILCFIRKKHSVHQLCYTMQASSLARCIILMCTGLSISIS